MNIREKIHYYLYLVGISIMLVGLPFSRFLMSVSQFILIGNWLIEGNLKEKFSKFIHHKIALSLTFIFFIHIIGLLWTSDFDYALKDLRTKLPLVVIPLVIFTSGTLKRKIKEFLLLLFTLSVTAINLYIFISYLFHLDYNMDVRDIIKFDSHIRLSLMICFSIFISIYFFFKEISLKKKLFWITLFLINTFLLFYLGYVTGIFVFLIIAFYYLISLSLKIKDFTKKIIAFTLLFFMIFVIGGLIIWEINDFFSLKEYKVSNTKKTQSGRIYYSDTTITERENGYRIYQYICYEELAREWNKRSQIKFHEKDLNGNPVSTTLIRYLSSKGLTKDSASVASLTNKEIIAICSGIANYKLTGFLNIRGKIHSFLKEIDRYIKYNNPNWSTIAQRIEYWKASIGIIKENFLIGVGTGDMNIAFEKYYNKTYSTLNTQLRRRSHNQFLSITVGFGIIGGILFVLLLFYPFCYNKSNTLYKIFFLIILISMFTEDTIESQMGVTFYAFFSCFLLSDTATNNES